MQANTPVTRVKQLVARESPAVLSPHGQVTGCRVGTGGGRDSPKLPVKPSIFRELSGIRAGGLREAERTLRASLRVFPPLWGKMGHQPRLVNARCAGRLLRSSVEPKIRRCAACG